MKARTIPFLASVCVFLALAASAGCDRGAKTSSSSAEGAASKPAAEGAPIAVRVERVEAGKRAEDRARVTGSFEADDLVTIGAKVAGRIAWVGPDVGDRVERGALLARVEDDRTTCSRATSARARSRRASTKLGLEDAARGRRSTSRSSRWSSARGSRR